MDGATKSAAWELTIGSRLELKPQGTQVLGLHVGVVDPNMTREIQAPQSNAKVGVAAAHDGLEAGLEEIPADGGTRQVEQSLSTARPIYRARLRG